MKTAILFIFVSFLLFLLFVAFSYLVKQGSLVQFDFDTTVKIQNHVPTNWDTLFSVLSLIGSFEITTLVLLLILLRRRLWRVLLVFIMYGLGLNAEILGKTLIYHPGPPMMFFRYNLRFLFPSFYVQTNYSYPSGHVVRISFLVVILAIQVARSKQVGFFTKCLLEIGLLAFLLLMTVSRVSLGEHWTSDVMAGVVLGISLGLLAVIPLLSSESINK